MNMREFQNAVHRKLLEHGWRVQRATPAWQGWEANRAYWEPAYIRRLGFRPQTIIDVGVAHGTPQLYAAFPDAQLILVEPLSEYFEGIARLLDRRRGVHIPAAAWSSQGSWNCESSRGRPKEVPTTRVIQSKGPATPLRPAGSRPPRLTVSLRSMTFPIPLV